MDENGIVNVLNALPTAKLIDTVSGAIGKAYEPHHKKKMADATAYEINKISNALRENSDIIATYNDGKIVASLPEFEEFKKRTMQRLAYQEFLKQNNIESVVDIAYEQLEKETEVSETPVSQDWACRFFDSVANINNEEMQKIWGRILSGEIKQPGSFSFRTLEVLKNLSQQEAETFEKLGPIVFRDKKLFFIPTDQTLLENSNIFYGDILTLDECGLLIGNEFITNNIDISSYSKNGFNLFSHDILLNIKCVNTENKKIECHIYPLTQAGSELYSIIQAKSSEQFVCDFAKKIATTNNLNVSAYKIISYNGSEVVCQSDAIGQWGEEKTQVEDK